VPGDNNKEDKGEEEQEHNQDEATHGKLNLSLLDGEQEHNEDE
jgi:hypothetical protein